MHINLDDWYKPQLDKKKLKELSRRSDLPGLIHFFFYFLFLFISGYLAYLPGVQFGPYFLSYMERFMHSV